MHKRFRKIISILLATMMIAGTIPTTVFATEENGVSQVVQEEQPAETVPTEQPGNNVVEEKSKDTSSDSSIDLISANASDKQQDDSVVGSNEISITEQAAAETAVSDEEQVSQEEAQQSPSEVSLTEEQEMTSDAASDVAEPTNDDISLTETESTWLETFINDQSSVEATADFSSCRLILGTANADVIIDREHIMSEYNGVYLLQYASESEAQLAYKYYYDKVDFVEPDITVSVADGEEVAEAPDGMTEEANPLNELENAIIEDSSSVKKNVIALIDTGVSDDNAVIDRTSMLGDAVDDDNGHGNKMLETILAVNPDAQIISIKALDENGKGTISSVYTAIEYAIERNASIINLSISAYSTAKNAAVADVIRRAVNAGITVVGAAGNNGRNAKYFVPGGIEEAMIVGACDENGQRIAISNYGDTVDYNVVAEYTSEAAAKMSSYLSANKTIEANTNGLIFTKDYVPTEEETELTPEETGLRWHGKLISEMTTEELYYAFIEIEKNHPDRTEVIPNMTPEEEAVVRAFYASDFVDQFLIAADTYKVTTNLEHLNYNYDGHEGGALVKYLSADHKAAYCVSPSAVFNPSTYDADRIAGQTRLRAAYSYALFHGLKFFKTGERCSETYSTGCLYGDYYVTQLALWDIQDALNKDADDTRDLSGMELLIGNSTSKIQDYILNVDRMPNKDERNDGQTTKAEVLDKANKLSKAARAYSKTAKISGDKYDMYSAKEPTVAFSVSSAKATKSGNFYQTPTITLTNTGEFPEKVDSKAYVPVNSITIDSVGKALGAEIVKVTNTTFYVKFPATSVNSDTSFSISTEGVNVLRHVAGTHKPVAWPSGTSEPQSVIWGSNVAVPITKTASMSVSVTPESYFYIKKKSSKPNITNTNSNYKLKDTTFAVYATEANAQNKTSALFTLKCTEEDANHIASTPLSQGLKAGTYYVRETVAGSGYKLNDTIYPVAVTTANTEDNPKILEIPNEPQETYVYLVKTSLVPEMTKGNKCYDLQGAVYEVFSDEACTKLVTTLTTGAEKDGKAETERKQVPIGTYYVKEKVAPKGYRLNEDSVTVTVTASNNTADKAAVVNVKDEPKGDPVDIRLTKEPTTPSASKNFPPLNNAEFTIKYYDGLYTRDNLPANATRTWVIKTITTKDKNGKEKYIASMELEDCKVSGDAYYTNSAGDICLPIGTITIQETKAPYDYSLAGGKISTSAGEVESDGMVIAQIKEETGRAQLEITNTLTAGDPEIIIETIATDKNTGTHFGRSKGDVEIIDTISYENVYDPGTYRFHGKLVDASDNSVIAEAYSTEFEPAEDGKGTGEVSFSTDLKAYEGKTVVVYEYLEEKKDGDKWEERAKHDEVTDEDQQIHVPKIRTTVTDAREGITVETHVAEAEKNAKLTDTIFYENLEAGKTYKFNGILVQIQEDGTAIPFRDPSGKEVTSETTKTIPENEAASDRFVKMDFEFDASELKNESLVVFEKCYLVKETGDGTEQVEVAEHEDPNDEKQTIHFPEITTTVTDDKTGTDHTEAEEESTITDRVYFSNVVPNIVYEVKGTVHDQKTGNEIPAEVVGATYNGESALETTGEGALSEKVVRFKPTAKEGYVDVTFKFNSKDLEGTTAVVFEELYVERRVAVHSDLKAQPQTDYIPKVRTSVRSDDTDTNLSNNNEEVYLTDTVTYHSLKPKTTYRVYGTLHIQDEDEEGNIVDGGIAPSVMVNEEHEEIPYYEFTTAEAPESNPNAGISGSVDIHFRMNLTDYEGKTLVCFEKLNLVEEGRDEVEVGRHEEIQDEAQSLHIPEIGTSAADKNSGLHVGLVDENVTVTDIVRFHNVVPGKTYKVRGILMERVVKEASEATTEPTVTTDEATDTNGDAQTDAGQTDDAVEGQIDTDGQTNATVEGQQDTDEQATDTDGQTETTTDGAEESGENTEPAVEYEAVPYLVDGEPVTAEAVIENAPANGEVKLEFVFNGKDLGDRRIVAFEYMSIANMEGEDVDIAEHEDIMDEEQTVWYPDVTTEAADETTDSHVGDSAEYNVLVDKVTMRGLLPDREYTVTGSVHLSETGEEIPSTMIDEEGNPIDGFIFTADQKDMEVVLRMRYKASDLAGKTVVAYEKVFTPGLDGEPKLIGRHEDPKDEEQSVHIPAVETVATDAKNDAKDTQAAESTTIKDVVKLSNLKVGYYYKVSGVLMSKKGKAPVKKDDGTEVRAESEVFVANATNMEKILNFELNTSEMTDDTLVAFEKLYFYGKETPVEEGSDDIKEIARHEDITDEDQSVNVIDLRTTATGNDTGSHEAGVDKETKIVDRVYYYGLDVNKEYTVKGTLRNKETGEPIKGATASKTFKPKKKDHYIDLTFTVDTRKLAGKKVVAFEDLYRDNIPVATHSNLEDEDQTVSIVEIKTSLKDKKTGKRTATEGKDTILIDTVTYKGLIPGNTYVMKGTLMDKETKKSTGIKKSVTFTADKSNGSVEIPFTVNTEKYAGKSLVAFEELYTEDNKLITTHKDIKDKKQTVAIPGNPEKPGSGNGTLSNVKTGDQMKPLLFAGIAVLALGIFLFVYFRKKKKA